MAKYSNINKLTREMRGDLFLTLVESLAGRKKPEAAGLLRDLLTEQESSMIARRLKIALLLQDGLSYAQIRRQIPVSDATIAKIQLWLKTYGDGFRLAMNATKKVNRPESYDAQHDRMGWQRLKKRYPMYFWPQLLLEEVVKKTSQREKQRLAVILAELRDKTPLTKQLNQLLRQNYHTT